jgi:geranylgeranyl pyrophosphate synthase
MWWEKQFRLFKEELESTLATLSDTPVLLKMATESLAQYADEAAISINTARPWPLLPLVVSETISNRYEHVIPVAAALQFLRAAADIIDDIEDADSPKSFANKYGPALAINLATTLIFLSEIAITRLRKTNVENGTILLVIDKIASYHANACSGQHTDLTLTLDSVISEEEYLKVVRMKSAFQVECACHVGAWLATPDKELIDLLTRFGQSLGMAVQIANEIQGITRGRDILKKRITLPIIYALTHEDNDVSNQLKFQYSRLSEPSSDITQIQNLLFRCGAIHYVTVKLEMYKQQALDVLSNLESEGYDVERLRLFLN